MSLQSRLGGYDHEITGRAKVLDRRREVFRVEVRHRAKRGFPKNTTWVPIECLNVEEQDLFRSNYRTLKNK